MYNLPDGSPLSARLQCP